MSKIDFRRVGLKERFLCPGCDRDVARLVEHHWYNRKGKYFTKEICDACNGMVGPLSGSVGITTGPGIADELGPIYPSWRTQLKNLRVFYRDNSPQEVEDTVMVRFRAMHVAHRKVGGWLLVHPDFSKERISEMLLPYRRVMAPTPENLIRASYELRDDDPSLDEFVNYDYIVRRGEKAKAVKRWMREHPEEVERVRVKHQKVLRRISGRGG